jgi:RNA polymerase sigma-70 factor (ECF subfamily)
MGDFERLYKKHLEAVFGFSLHCVGRREIAEEITSEAFLMLYQHLDRIDEQQLPAWLFTVARNRAVDYWRRQKVEQRYAIIPQEPSVMPRTPGQSLLDNDKLNAVHRVCLILRYVHGMSRAEIARHTGASETQVKGHLQYALQLLRKELGRKSRKVADAGSTD